MGVEDLNIIWITWEIHRRSRNLKREFNFRFCEFDFDRPRLFRYAICLAKTVEVLMKMKPSILMVQNPSIVLTVFAIFFQKIYRYKLVVDAHNSGIYPLEGKCRLLMDVSRWIQRRVDLVIVTNKELQRVVEKNGGQAVVLPDKLPSPPNIKSIELDGRTNVAYICTFSEDEPFREVLSAARMIDSDILIYFTGKYEGKVQREKIPPNVKLLGYVPEEEYWSLLNSADIVMDLTLRENCLVCGAYEAVSLGKPMILSDTEALRTYFSAGCVYVKPNATSIAQGIKTAINNLEVLRQESIKLKTEIEKKWNKTFEEVKMRIYDLIENGYSIKS